MKVLIYVLGFIAATASDKVFDGTLPDTATLCYRLTNFDGENIKDLSWNNPQFTCFHACMMEQRHEIQGGKIRLDKYIENHFMEYDPYMDEKARMQIVDCALQANTQKDKCSVAGIMGKCITENWQVIVNESK